VPDWRCSFPAAFLGVDEMPLLSDNLTFGGFRNIADSREIILAIESAIAGGSLSLIQNGEPIAGACGDSGVSRAEDLIPNIESLLDSAGILRDQVDSIAISIGPGSFTGLRIGLSTAIGLSAALDKPRISTPLFNAIASSLDVGRDFTIAIPIGRSDICYQQFDRHGAERTPIVASDLEFVEYIQTTDYNFVACHPNIIGRLRPHLGSSELRLHTLNQCLAEYVGLYAAKDPVRGPLDPIYVQNPRFG